MGLQCLLVSLCVCVCVLEVGHGVDRAMGARRDSQCNEHKATKYKNSWLRHLCCYRFAHSIV